MNIAESEAESVYPTRYWEGTRTKEMFEADTDDLQEAYIRGREALPTDAEIEAGAKYLKANPGLFGSSACFIDPNRFEEIARGVLQAARTAVHAERKTIK